MNLQFERVWRELAKDPKDLSNILVVFQKKGACDSCAKKMFYYSEGVRVVFQKKELATINGFFFGCGCLW